MHELADGREDGGDGLIVRGELFVEPGLELRESPSQLFVRAEQLAQLHEGTHDLDVDGDRAIAVEYRGEHCHALLGEGIGQVLAMLAAAVL